MPGKKKDSTKYLAGISMLIALMIIAIVLGWYGLEIAKKSMSNSSTTSITQTTSTTNATSITKTNSSTTTTQTNTSSKPA